MTSKIKLSLFISCDEDITEYREVLPKMKDETVQ